MMCQSRFLNLMHFCDYFFLTLILLLLDFRLSCTRSHGQLTVSTKILSRSAFIHNYEPNNAMSVTRFFFLFKHENRIILINK